MKRKRLIALHLLVTVVVSSMAYYSAVFYEFHQREKQAFEQSIEDIHFEQMAQDNTSEYRGSSSISLSSENFFVLDGDFVTISPEIEGRINSVQFCSFRENTLCKCPPVDFFLTFRSIII